METEPGCLHLFFSCLLLLYTCRHTHIFFQPRSVVLRTCVTEEGKAEGYTEQGWLQTHAITAPCPKLTQAQLTTRHSRWHGHPREKRERKRRDTSISQQHEAELTVLPAPLMPHQNRLCLIFLSMCPTGEGNFLSLYL